MALLKQTTARTRTFVLIQTSDHISGLTGAAGSTVVQYSKNGGAMTSSTNVAAEIGLGWYSIALTTSETSTLGDLSFHITATSGDPTDFADQVVLDLPGASVQSVTNGVTVSTNNDKTGYSLNSSQTTVTIGTVANPVTSGTVLDKTGYALSQAFPSNFAAMAILAGGQVGIDWGNIARTATINILSGTTINTSQTVNTPASSDPWATALPGGYSAGTAGNIVGNNLDLKISSRMSSAQTVVVGTNNDKTGYSLSQSFPANFASLAITGGGAVTVGTNNDKNGYSLNSSQTTVTLGFVNTINNGVTVSTNNDKTGYALTPQERGAIVSSAQSTLMTESYAAKAVAPSIAQILFEMRSHLTEKSINTTSVSLYQLDGATIWGAATLDTTTPTTIHRGA